MSESTSAGLTPQLGTSRKRPRRLRCLMFGFDSGRSISRCMKRSFLVEAFCRVSLTALHGDGIYKLILTTSDMTTFCILWIYSWP